MRKINIEAAGNVNEVLLVVLDEVDYTRRELGTGNFFQKLFKGEEVVAGEYLIRIMAKTYEQVTRELFIVDVNEKDGSFTTEDGITYSVQDFRDDSEEQLFKGYTSGMLKYYFGYLKQQKRIGGNFGKLILKSIYD